MSDPFRLMRSSWRFGLGKEFQSRSGFAIEVFQFISPETIRMGRFAGIAIAAVIGPA